MNKRRIIKHLFGLVLAYILYLLLSYFISFTFKKSPTYEERLIYTAFNYLILISSILITTKYFINFPIKKLFGSFSLAKFTYTFIYYFSILTVTEFIWMLLYPNNFKYTFNNDFFIIKWACTLITLSFSAMAEELIFRSVIGYFISDELETRTKIQLIYCFFSGLLFSLAHFLNPEVIGLKAIYAMSFYFIMGFSLMYIYLKTKSIYIPFAIHLANNLVSAFLFSYPDAVINTNSLYTQYNGINIILLLQTIFCMVLTIPFIKKCLFNNEDNTENI